MEHLVCLLRILSYIELGNNGDNTSREGEDVQGKDRFCERQEKMYFRMVSRNTDLVAVDGICVYLTT